MTAGDRNRSTLMSFLKSEMLHQPCRRDFNPLRSSEVRHLQALPRCHLGEALVLLRRDDRILEKRAGAAAVFVALDNKHCLLLADAAHRLPRLRQCWVLRPTSEIAAQVSVFQLRLSVTL